MTIVKEISIVLIPNMFKYVYSPKICKIKKKIPLYDTIVIDFGLIKLNLV